MLNHNLIYYFDNNTDKKGEKSVVKKFKFFLNLKKSLGENGLSKKYDIQGVT
jgi:hypothetical protein